MKTTALIAALALTTGAAQAEAERYALDPSHSQVLFSFDHFGFSTTFGLFSGFEGEIMFDEADPAASSVSVSMQVTSMFTGWEQRDVFLMSGDFFDASEEDEITFESTGIEITGETTAKITGDLTMNDVTKSVVLDTNLNKSGTNPLIGKPWLGFNATATVLRSDFNMGAFAPAVSDEVALQISVEAEKAE